MMTPRDPVYAAAQQLVAQFQRMKGRQDELLGHDFASACRNWDEHPEAFSEKLIDFQPLIDALALLAAPPAEGWQPQSFDAALSFLEAIQAQGVYLHDAHGEALDRAAFLAVVTKALDALPAPPRAPQPQK